MSRVLWLTQVFPRYAGDPYGSFLLRLAREMPSRGWEITVIAPGDEGAPAREDLDGVHVERFDPRRARAGGLAYRGEMHRQALRRPLAFARFLRAFRAAAADATRKSSPALLHAHWWVPTGMLAKSVAARAGLPWVVSLHGTDVRLVRRMPWLRGLAGATVRTAAAVLPVSSALDEEVARWNVPHRVILPMPADGDLFVPGEASPTPAGDVARFVVVARLTAQKRVGDVLAAVQQLPAGVRVTVDVVGDGPERAALERRAAGIPAGIVRFLGMLPLDRMPAVYRGARAVLLPSEGEGYGLTVVEGALCGIPAIVARSGALTEVVEHERTGLVIPLGDVDGLALAMARLAGNPHEAQRFGAQARRRAQALTADSLAERLASVYEETTRA